MLIETTCAGKKLLLQKLGVVFQDKTDEQH